MWANLIRIAGALALSANVVIAQASPPRKQLVEDLRLDATSEDLTPGVWATVGPHGIMAVSLTEDQQIRLYDSTGKRLGAIGRVGSGPGEFRRMLRYGWLGDTLWVYDATLYRITYIGTGGKLIRSTQLPVSLNADRGGSKNPALGSMRSMVPNAITASGDLLGPASFFGGMTPGGLAKAESFVVAVSSKGSLLNRIATQPSFEKTSVSYQPGNGSSASAIIPFAFPPQTDYAADGSRIGFVSVDQSSPTGGTYVVTVLRPTGDTVFSRAFPFAATPVPQTSIDSALARFGIGADGKQFFSPQAAAKLKELARARIPAAYSPVSAFGLGLEGTTWIQLRRPSPAAPATAVILDSRGQPLFTVDVPPRSRIIEASLSQIWVIHTDEDDLRSIVRYRVK